ncbi:unnamed protein product [Urochloa humidicola]
MFASCTKKKKLGKNKRKRSFNIYLTFFRCLQHHTGKDAEKHRLQRRIVASQCLTSDKIRLVSEVMSAG